jgi:hypothetical protein
VQSAVPRGASLCAPSLSLLSSSSSTNMDPDPASLVTALATAPWKRPAAAMATADPVAAAAGGAVGDGDCGDPKMRHLMCASPTCWFWIHESREFGGYCCRKCYWRTYNQSTCRWRHGPACEKLVAPSGTERARPVPPD